MLSSGTWQTARVQHYVPFCCAAYSGEDACVASQPGQPGVEPGTARFGPAIAGVTVVADAPGSGTASHRRADQPDMYRHLPVDDQLPGARIGGYLKPSRVRRV